MAFDARRRSSDESVNQDTDMADGISLSMGSPEYVEFVNDRAPELEEGLVQFGGKANVDADDGSPQYYEERPGGMYDRRAKREQPNVQARRAEGFYRNERELEAQRFMRLAEFDGELRRPQALKSLENFVEDPAARELEEYDGPGMKTLRKYM